MILSGNNIQELYEKANHDVEELNKWLCANKLMLNTTKTKYMIFGNHDTKITPIYISK